MLLSYLSSPDENFAPEEIESSGSGPFNVVSLGGSSVGIGFDLDQRSNTVAKCPLIPQLFHACRALAASPEGGFPNISWFILCN